MTIENRMEILFIYETKDCNPNGDPLDENRPRTDPDTGVALVTDVRIKRTIRDYLLRSKKKDILVKDTFDDKGFLRDGKGRAQSFEEAAGVTKNDNLAQAIKKLETYILGNFIDARLFGATLPVKAGSVQITGPVQFSGFSRSLNRVNPQFVQGTAAYASKEGSVQKSFREDYICPYACIATYGIMNEIAARDSMLSNEDVDHLLEALWYGTASLISRSKIGHQPLFLMRVTYKGQRQTGNLSGKLSLLSDVEDEKIRDISQYRVDATRLVDAMKNQLEFIESVDVYQDPALQFVAQGKTGVFGAVASGLKVKEFEINSFKKVAPEQLP